MSETTDVLQREFCSLQNILLWGGSEIPLDPVLLQLQPSSQQLKAPAGKTHFKPERSKSKEARELMKIWEGCSTRDDVAVEIQGEVFPPVGKLRGGSCPRGISQKPWTAAKNTTKNSAKCFSAVLKDQGERSLCAGSLGTKTEFPGTESGAVQTHHPSCELKK